MRRSPVAETEPDVSAAIARPSPMRKSDWMAHWGELEPIPDGQGLPGYAADCVAKLCRAANRIYQTLHDAILASPPNDEPARRD